MPDFTDPTQTAGLNAMTRVIRLDPGLFALSLEPVLFDPASGLPGVRVSLPPGPPRAREAVTIGMMRSDGWMTAGDEPTLLRAAASGGHVMVTLYWAAGQPPALKLERMTQAAPPGMMPGMAPGFPPAPHPMAPVAEIVAHIEGHGDVEGRIGDWVGQRGSGRAIEGFSLTPRTGIGPDDFECRAVLGRDWLSPWLPGGRFCGSRGLALPLRGFSLRLRGPMAAQLDFACMARFVDGAEAGPIRSDQICVSPTMAALEVFQVSLRPRIA